MPIASALGLILASTPVYLADTPVFRSYALASDLSVTAVAIIEDSRCETPAPCFGRHRLLVAAVVRDRGHDWEYSAELGEPIFLREGVLTLVDTATPPREGSAIPLSRYRLDWVFEPYE